MYFVRIKSVHAVCAGESDGDLPVVVGWLGGILGRCDKGGIFIRINITHNSEVLQARVWLFTCEHTRMGKNDVSRLNGGGCKESKKNRFLRSKSTFVIDGAVTIFYAKLDSYKGQDIKTSVSKKLR